MMLTARRQRLIDKDAALECHCQNLLAADQRYGDKAPPLPAAPAPCRRSLRKPETQAAFVTWSGEAPWGRAGQPAALAPLPLARPLPSGGCCPVGGASGRLPSAACGCRQNSSMPRLSMRAGSTNCPAVSTTSRVDAHVLVRGPQLCASSDKGAVTLVLWQCVDHFEHNITPAHLLPLGRRMPRRIFCRWLLMWKMVSPSTPMLDRMALGVACSRKK